MPVHPQAQALLGFMAQHTVPSSADVSMPELRAAFFELSRPRRVPQIAKVQDIHCPGPVGRMRIRVYNPEPHSTAAQPTLIFIHGGGWCFESVESHDAVCRGLALQADIVVLSLDYRLAPEHPFPAAVDDCHAATRWIFANAADLNVDRSRIAIGGDSAGGNLALTTLMQAEKNHDMQFATQLLLYPCVDIAARTESRKLFAKGFGISEDVGNFVSTYYAQGHDLQDPLMSPYFAPDLSFMPPTLIVTAESDPVRDEAKLFSDRLQKEGVVCTYKCCEGMVHGFMNHMYIMPLDAAEEATTMCAMHLKTVLK